MRAGGVVLFPSDTVYGLACAADDPGAVERLYALKGRPPRKPAAVMFFSLAAALAELAELGPVTREALKRLLPGPVGVLLPNPAHRFPLACAGDPSTLGLRVPALPRLGDVEVPVLQSSANLSGGADPRTLDEVPHEIRAGVELAIDGGPLPGTPSTMVDLRGFEASGGWSIVREGAVPRGRLEALLG